MSGMPIRILHIISGLNTGGAETVLHRLLSKIDQNTFYSEVISLTDIGTIGKKIKELGVTVKALDMKRGVPNPYYILKIIKIIKEMKPDIIQTWMFHADLIGGIAGRLSGSNPIVWNIRNSSLNDGKIKRTTQWTIAACAKVSHLIPHKIIIVSEKAKMDFIKAGYDKNKIRIVYNGIDTNLFKPNSQAKEIFCKEHVVPEDCFLIGLIARFDPQKDHYNFIKAAHLVSREYPSSYFVLCGEGVVWENTNLVHWINEFDLKNSFRLLGNCENIEQITASLDLAVLTSSYGEGFPNVLAEAMACGVPCVSTNVGDAKTIVGNTGIIVPPNNSEALSNAISNLLAIKESERKKMGLKARQRIENNFSLMNMVKKYEGLYKDINYSNNFKGSIYGKNFVRS